MKTFFARLFAKAIHRKNQKWIANPHEAQQKTLHFLLKTAQNTQFGKDHNFKKIDTYQDFKVQVPVRNYEGIRPYVERILQGEKDILWPGQPLYLAIYIGLIVFFAFFYTAIVFNPEDTAENLRRNGGYIPGIRPGQPTADYLDYILTRLTVLGAAYLSAVCILPEILISNYAIPFYFGGTSLLIVVTVTLDTVSQIQSHLMAHQYEGLIKKSRLKGRNR